jgi:hypothetical protein
VSELPHPLAALGATSEQLPEPGAEVRAAEHRVQRDPREHEHERNRLQEHLLRRLKLGASFTRKVKWRACQAP